MLQTIKKTYATLDARYITHMKVFRYLVSGGTATAVDLALLYVFTDILGMWYILSSIVAFLISFVVSFILQKFWTFNDRKTERWHSQALIYLIVTSLNLGLNTLGIFLFVHYADFHYMAAQFVVSALIAIESYFVYHFIFKIGARDQTNINL